MYKLYKRFFSKAAKACKNKKFKEKTTCMIKHRVYSYMKTIKYLEHTRVSCNTHAEKPDKCKNSVDKEIKKIDDKLIPDGS